MQTLEEILEIQKNSFSNHPYPSLKQRKENLKLVLKIIFLKEYINEI